MNNCFKNITKGFVAFSAVVTVLGLALLSMKKPKKKAKNGIVSALNTAGEIMQGIADMMF